MPNAIGIDPRPDLLRDQIDEIILKILRDVGNQRHATAAASIDLPSANELGTGIGPVTCRVRIDNVAENKRVQQRKHLIDRRQHQRGKIQSPVVAQIAVKCRHVLNITGPLLWT